MTATATLQEEVVREHVRPKRDFVLQDEDFNQRLRAQAMQEQMRGCCVMCDWIYEATAAEVIEAQKGHRREHGRVPNKPKRRDTAAKLLAAKKRERMEEAKPRILELLRERGSLSIKNIEDALADLPSRSAVKDATRELVTEGHLREIWRGAPGTGGKRTFEVVA